MKKVAQIVLGIIIIGLVYLIFEQIMTPLRFKKELAVRETFVINRIKDIRTSQRAFKQVNNRFTGDLDSLVNFVLNDSLTVEKTIGSKDDSIAVAKGLVRTEKFRIPAIDTIFGRKVTPDEIKQMVYVPFSKDEATGREKRFIMNAGMFETESGVVVPVFEARAPYSWFLADLNRQELINLIDERQNTLGRYPGIMVGAMDKATNDAGNWE